MHACVYLFSYVCVFACEFVCVQPAEARGGATLEVELMVAVCHRVGLGTEPGPPWAQPVSSVQPLRVSDGGVGTSPVVTAL